MVECPNLSEPDEIRSPTIVNNNSLGCLNTHLHPATIKVSVLGSAFFLIFSSYNVLQNLTSTLLPSETAFWTLGLIYLLFGISNIFLPTYIISRIGSQRGLVVGVVPYLLLSIVYTLCAFIYTREMMMDPSLTMTLNAIYLPIACLLGMGASVLWTSQGTYLSQVSDNDNMGYLSGLFFGISLLNGVFGCLLSAFMLSQNANKGSLFTCLTVIAAIGAIILCFLPTPSSHSQQDVLIPDPPLDSPTETLLQKQDSNTMDIWMTSLEFMKLHQQPGLYTLIPLFYLSGLSQAFSSGTLPLLIVQNDMTDTHWLSLKLYLLSVYSGSNALGSLVLGKLGDTWGTRIVLTSNMVLQTLAMLLLAFVYEPNQLVTAFLSACFLGLCDAMVTTQTFSLINTFVKQNNQPNLIPISFSIYKFHQSLGAAIVFVASKNMLDSQGFPLLKSIWLPLILVFIVISFMALFANYRK